MKQEYIDRVWMDNPQFMRKYYELLPKHEKLCNEIEYILKTLLRNEGIEIAHTEKRAKKASSFCEKIFRKQYANPFDEIRDLAGVRIVYLYMSDMRKIEEVIEKGFNVIEKDNKSESRDVEKFGYEALHYVVKIRKEQTGARYDDLKNLLCEIQVRTILQDAWAIVAHHLSYKQESDVPKILRRKLHALSGLFVTADDQFEGLKQAIDKYTEKVEEKLIVSKDTSLDEELNLDNLMAYLTTRFPDRRVSARDDVSELLQELKEYGYTSLQSVNQIIERAIDAVLEDEKEHPPVVGDEDEVARYLPVGIVRTVLSYVNEDYCLNKYGESMLKKQQNYMHLLKDE